MDAKKILFLDVDGVLNSWQYAATLGQTSLLRMDPRAVALLYDIVCKTGCKIVVSSTWRIGGIGARSDFRKYINECDPSGPNRTLTKSVIGATPILNTPRGEEIKTWIDEHNFEGNFVIVDDDSDMGDLMPHLVKTTMDYGLTSEIADEIIRRLNADQERY